MGIGHPISATWGGPVAHEVNRIPAASQRPTLSTYVLVAVAYFVGAKVGFACTVGQHPTSVLWPPNTTLLVALLLTPVRSWPMMLLAVLPAHLAAERGSGVPPLMVLCWFVSNACEALFGAAATRFFIRGRLEFDQPRTLGIFFLCGVFFAPILSSFVDAAFVELNQWGSDSYWEVWRMRSCSNIFATATVGVTILTWVAGGRITANQLRARFVEAGLLALGLVSVSLMVLHLSGARSDFGCMRRCPSSCGRRCVSERAGQVQRSSCSPPWWS